MVQSFPPWEKRDQPTVRPSLGCLRLHSHTYLGLVDLLQIGASLRTKELDFYDGTGRWEWGSLVK